MSDLYIETKQLMNRLYPRPKKSLGQNFLVDPGVLDRIAQAADIQKNEPVLEIGPGLGWLTDRLLPYAPQLILIEKDDRLAPFLVEKYKRLEQVKVLHGDILDHTLWQKLPSKVKIVANIPYSITSPLLQRIALAKIDFIALTLMVQKEVGERLASQAHQSNRGALSVFVQSFYQVSSLFDVPATAFWPAPKVTSSIITLRKIEQDFKISDKNDYLFFLQQCFAQKRRKLKNNLMHSFNFTSDKVAQLLSVANIDGNLRPEDLEVIQWVKLYERWVGK